MSTRLRYANSITRTAFRAPANALLLMLAVGTAAALRAQQSADKSQAGTYSLLYSFQCSPDGGFPGAGLIRDSSGNLYSTTFDGGQFDHGTVFKVTSGGVETVLHSFGSFPLDGYEPEYGSLTLDAAGDVYGTTQQGGEFGYGTVFKVTATGTESILYNFCGLPKCADGETPLGGMARDSAGNLYGTTDQGGISDSGVLFKLTPGGTESVLHNFEDSSSDGAYPTGNLTQDSSGHLYGTTAYGGASDYGTVFEVTPSGGESLLHSFAARHSDGVQPFGGGLLHDTLGNLYGVTTNGGASGYGVLFKLTPGDTETVLLNFAGGAGGAIPYDGLAKDGDGNLYGTTGSGGAGCPPDGCGVLFELTTAGKEIVLHDFILSSSSDGAYPRGGVVRDPSGNLYGTLTSGGAYGCGAVFKYMP
jgi:uncharacterized repeat protein (TIGR03803 family)